MSNFKYVYGPVETTKPWKRPSWEVLEQWWEDFKKIDGVDKYEFYLVGGMLIDIKNTWDADVLFTGRPGSLDEIGRLITVGRDMALNKYRMFIDIFWYDDLSFCYPETDGVDEIDRKYYFRAELNGREIKIRNGIEEVNKPIGSDCKYKDNNEYPISILPKLAPSSNYCNEKREFKNRIHRLK